jgi:hypothetical protein
LYIGLTTSDLSTLNWVDRSDKRQTLFIFKCINKSLKILIKKTVINLFSKIYSLDAGLLWETVNGLFYHKIPSPDSSGKPMPVENHFFLVVSERPKEAPDSG